MSCKDMCVACVIYLRNSQRRRRLNTKEEGENEMRNIKEYRIYHSERNGAQRYNKLHLQYTVQYYRFFNYLDARARN